MSITSAGHESAEPIEHQDAGEGLESVEIQRDGPLSGLIGVTAAGVGIAYLLRAVGSGSLLDWALCALTLVVAVLHLATLVDSRAPLMIVDELGIRVRRGATWEGVSWPEVARVEHTPRRSTLRDGRLVVVDVHGRQLATRLSLSTRLIGADWHQLTAALGELADARAVVIEVGAAATVTEPVVDTLAGTPAEPAAGTDIEPAVVHPASEQAPLDPALDPALDAAGDLAAERSEDEAVVVPDESHEEPVATTPLPTRDPVPGRRTDVVLERTFDDHRTEVIAAPIIAPGETSTVLIGAVDDETSEAVPEESLQPVVGLVLAQARTRVGLSVDQLADRTRIRPHVIEAIEADRFETCGGDFYARGHLRTLARVLGVDATPLLAEYDARYADAPIDPRRVFEAELATAGSAGRGVGGALNWSVLVAVVMAVVLVWSVARLVMDGPVPLSDQPVLNGSPRGKATLSGATTKTPVTFTAVTGGARVIVRDGKQQVVFDEQLAFMQTAELSVVPPVRISSTDGGLQVSVDGVDKGAIGATGQDAQQTFVP